MSEATIRLAFFATLLTLFLLAEWRWPRNRAVVRRGRRWPTNLGFGLIDSLSLRLLSPWLAYAVALRIQDAGIGLFNSMHVPSWLVVTVWVVLLDLTIYWQHRLMHVVPWLWRLHRLHHTDLALDASSAVRFHPLEILFSLGIKLGAVIVLGAPPLAVLVFEILLSSLALFTHANLALPVRFERVLRRVLVTPDMHRIHHSVDPREHNLNSGFNASWWDRMFGSYLDQPGQSQQSMCLGLDVFRADADQRFDRLQLQPVPSSASESASD